MHYLRDGGLYSDIQVFHLAILPGTAFREEAAALGLQYQLDPPITSCALTLHAGDIGDLIREAEELFEVDFDIPLAPALTVANDESHCRVWHVDLDIDTPALPMVCALKPSPCGCGPMTLISGAPKRPN